MGLNSFSELGPSHLLRRTNEQVGETYAELYNWLQPGELLSGTRFHNWAEAWETADPDTFHYPAVHMRGSFGAEWATYSPISFLRRRSSFSRT